MVGKGKTKKLETRVYSVRDLSHSVEWYHELPEEPLLKWIVKVTNVGAVSLALSASEWKSMFGLV